LKIKGEFIQEVAWYFAMEWSGNLKEGQQFTVGDLIDLARLYPEIWGEYVEAYQQTKRQEFNEGISGRLGEDLRENIEGDISPRPGWTNGETGFDTDIESL